MKLIIEIPEEDYIRLRDEGMFGNVTTFKRAVREGIPLPKGHGRLIDADAVLEDPIGNTYRDIDIAETIIEADKEGDDE